MNHFFISIFLNFLDIAYQLICLVYSVFILHLTCFVCCPILLGVFQNNCNNHHMILSWSKPEVPNLGYNCLSEGVHLMLENIR